MKFHKFDDYVKRHTDYKIAFFKKIGLACQNKPSHEYFKHIENKYDLLESDIPIILCDNFSFDSIRINESNSSTYNSAITPSLNEVFSDFKNKNWIPNAVDNIQNVKLLKFPVTASNGNKSDLYKTLHKLRQAETRYKMFTESPQPRTRFKIVAFKNYPICGEEKINNMSFDMDLNSFKHSNQITDIVNDLYESYKLDVFNIDLIESLDGKIYLSDLNKNLNLNPHQAYTVYNNIYQDHYNSKLPPWVKNRILDEDLSDYYKRKYFDSKLIKSKYSMDYSKLFKK
jgi:hypothetical protein